MHRKTVLLLALLGACTTDGRGQVLAPVVLGMPATTPPSYDDGETRLYQVNVAVPLPTRRPNDGERPTGAADPYPRAPFQRASDTRITARFTLTNLGDEPRTVELLVDPWNEFVRYVPGVAIGRNDRIEPNLSGIDRFFVVPAKSRIEGIVTPDDFVELATDLGTAMAVARRPPTPDSQFAGPVLYNRAFNEQNRSSEPDLVLAPYRPSAVAGIVGFDLGLRTSQPSAVAVELVIDILDLDGNRVIEETDSADRPVGRPGTALTPPAAPPR